MKRAISMKCNQEQWDAIKDKLVGLDIANFATKYRLKPDHSKEIAELERQIQILKNK